MWKWCKDIVFACCDGVQSFCGDWGLAIIIITIIFRLLIYPITAKQTKSSYQMQKLQPKIKEIQAKYADNPQKMNEETQKIYQESKYNPLAGCLPMLLQMPIFIILFQVLREYLPSGASFYSLVPDLTLAPQNVFGFSSEAIIASIPYIILMLFFSVSMFIPILIQKTKDKQTLTMMIVMSVFMLWVSWTSPAGVLLYWDISSLFGIVQQIIIQNALKKKDEIAAETVVVVEPVRVDVERKVKKNKPTRKGH